MEIEKVTWFGSRDFSISPRSMAFSNRSVPSYCDSLLVLMHEVDISYLALRRNFNRSLLKVTWLWDHKYPDQCKLRFFRSPTGHSPRIQFIAPQCSYFETNLDKNPFVNELSFHETPLSTNAGKSDWVKKSMANMQQKQHLRELLGYIMFKEHARLKLLHVLQLLSEKTHDPSNSAVFCFVQCLGHLRSTLGKSLGSQLIFPGSSLV